MEQIGLEAVFKDEGFNQGITDYQRSIDSAEKKTSGFSRATGLIGGAAKIGVAGVIGIAGAAVGAAGSLSALVMKSADNAAQLVEMSEKTGINVERLQELRFIGDQTGTSLETITGTLTRLKRSMGDVATSKQMATNFEKLGVAVYDSEGNLRDSEEVFTDAIGSLGMMTNETERDALAMEIFGRSATELNPLILAGADGLAAMSQQARDMGAVMSEDAVYGLEGFGDSVDSLKASFGGVLGQIATAVLPIFTELADKLIAFVKSPEFQAGVENLVKWLSENLPIAIQAVSDFFIDVLIPAIQAVWDFIGDFIAAVTGWWSEHGEQVIGIVQGIWDFIVGIYDRARESIENIIELFQLAQEGKWTEFGEKIREIVDKLWEEVKTIFKNAIDAVIKFFTDTDWGQVGLNIVKGIANGITGAVDWIIRAVEGIGGAAIAAIKGFLGIGSPSKVFEAIGENLMQSMALGIMEMSYAPAQATRYAAMATTTQAASYPVTNNRTSNFTLNMGGVSISSGIDMENFISRVEYAIQRAMQ